MRLHLRIVALATGVALGLVAAMPPVRADMGRPTWSPGDSWAYQVRGEQAYLLSGTGTMRMDVVGTDTVTVGGANYEAYRVRTTVNMTSSGGDWESAAGTSWYRTSDLALVKQDLNVSFVFIIRINLVLTVTLAPPLEIRWPLTAGNSWPAASTLRVTSVPGGWGLNANLDADYVVQSAATVTVPAGTFDATPVRETMTGGDYTMTYWSLQVGNSARTQSFDNQDREQSSAELTSYRYQGAGFLGLPLVVWLLLILVVIIVVIALVFRRRQQPRGAQLPPPGYPPR